MREKGMGWQVILCQVFGEVEAAVFVALQEPHGALSAAVLAIDMLIPLSCSNSKKHSIYGANSVYAIEIFNLFFFFPSSEGGRQGVPTPF